MFNSADVLRFADRFFDRAHPDSIDRQSRLLSCVVLVSIFHIVMSIAFVKMEEWEQKHRVKAHAPIEIAFSGLIAPVDFAPRKAEAIPQAQVLIPFKNGNTGSRSGARAGKQEENAILESKQANRSDSEKVLLAVKNNPSTSIISPVGKQEQIPAKSELAEEAKLSEGRAIDERKAAAVSGFEDGTNNDALSDHGAADDLGDDGNTKGNYGVDDAPPGQEQERAAQAMQYMDIAPYRKEMLLRIAGNWKPSTKKPLRIVLLITLAKDGRLLRVHLLESNSNRKTNQYTLDRIAETEFAPLPAECRRESISFKIDLSKEGEY